MGLLRLILSLTGRHTNLLGAHAKARATHLALLAGFAGAAFVFLLALATVALSRWLGTLPALGIMAGLCLLGCGVVLLLMRAERRAHLAAQRLQAQEDQRLLAAAALTALPKVRRGGVLAALGLGLAAALATGRRKRRREDARD